MKPPQAKRARVAWALALLLLVPAGARAASTVGLHTDREGPVYRVGAIVLEYAEAHALHPPLEDVMAIDFALGAAQDGYVGPRRGGNNVWFRLDEIAEGAPIRIYATGLRELHEQLVAEYNRRGLIGVYVVPHPLDIDPDSGADLRPPDRATLRLVVHTGRAAGLRTFATGRHVAAGDRAEKPAHERIKRDSPLQPVGAGGRAQGDLLLRDELDRYLAYLNRHPGRRVDVAVTPTREPGGVYVDYLVAESRAWSIHSQWSNTGTDQTTDARQRFGFTHNQLTGNDDVLRVDYVTGDFDEVNAAFASYEFPLPQLERSRMRLSGSWSDYDASQFGFSRRRFEGRQWSAGADLVRTLYQRGDLFLDATAGVRFMNVEVTNLASPTGDEDFVVPSLGVEIERLRDTSTLVGSLGVEHNLASLAGTSSDELDLFLLGRPQVDDDWTLLRWNAYYSFYLEPLLRGRAWHNPRTPASSTLAHEIALRTAGQYAFDTRLIPQTEFVLGGFHTVRGYEQATIASDSALLLSAEYRYHWPRSFRPAAPRELPLLGTFRVTPERVYGRPDWDLVLRAFVDWGRAMFSGSVAGEQDETLASVGVGFELMLRRNVSLRLDYGIAQNDVREVESGDSEAHFLVSFRY